MNNNNTNKIIETYKNITTLIFAVPIFLFLLLLFTRPIYNKIEVSYQHDADIIRLKHLVIVGDYIERYHKKTNTYPFANSDSIPTYVIIASKKQIENESSNYIFPNNREISVKLFVKELENVLNEEIQIPYDPQYTSSTPFYYEYMTVEQNYYLSANLFNNYSFSRNSGCNDNRIIITNTTNLNYTAWNYNELINNQNFIKVINENLYNKKYFDKY